MTAARTEIRDRPGLESSSRTPTARNSESPGIGRQDNNVAEYVALLEALQHAISVNARALHVYSDSEMVVKQMTGQYACRSPRLYSLNWTCRKLARSLDFSIAHISRELNLEANELANHAARSRKTA